MLVPLYPSWLSLPFLVAPNRQETSGGWLYRGPGPSPQKTCLWQWICSCWVDRLQSFSLILSYRSDRHICPLIGDTLGCLQYSYRIDMYRISNKDEDWRLANHWDLPNLPLASPWLCQAPHEWETMRQLEEDLQSVGENAENLQPKETFGWNVWSFSKWSVIGKRICFCFASIILERLFRMGLSLTINGVTCFLITGKVP